MKRLIFSVFLILLSMAFMVPSLFASDNASKPIYSIISTSFTLTKQVKCDRLKAAFLIYAEGDNYSMALRRLQSINNKFLKFLKGIFPAKDIQTNSSFQYSNRASLIVKLDTGKVEGLKRVLGFIAEQSFPYKTGIRTEYIRYTLSDKLREEIKGDLFKEALKKAKAKLLTVNEILGGGYEVKKLTIGSPSLYRFNRSFGALMTKSMAAPKTSSSSLEVSPGSVRIDLSVNLELIRKITQ